MLRQGEPADETPAGYIVYLVRQDWSGHRARHTARVMELIAATSEARRALWRFVASLDLVARVETENAPPDEPLEWMLEDPRVVRVSQLVEGMYVRLLDVPQALRSRAYGHDAALTLEVSDSFLPECGGVFRLSQSRGRVTCRRADETRADLSLSSPALASLYLGDHGFGKLADAGRVVELPPGALETADRMFAARPLPWSATVF